MCIKFVFVLKTENHSNSSIAFKTGQGTEEKDNENASVYLAKNGYTV